jgi:hypothetical protein
MGLAFGEGFLTPPDMFGGDKQPIHIHENYSYKMLQVS